MKKGDSIDVIILGVDVDQRRISLGHKQLNDNPWDTFGGQYKVNTEVEGKVVRIIEKGVIVELPLGVDGFVPLSQLSQTPIKNLAEAFQVGDKLPMCVIEFDGESKKIVLSVVEYLRGKEQKIIDEYVAKHKLPPITLKDAMPVEMTAEEKRAADEEAALK